MGGGGGGVKNEKNIIFYHLEYIYCLEQYLGLVEDDDITGFDCWHFKDEDKCIGDLLHCQPITLSTYYTIYNFSFFNWYILYIIYFSAWTDLFQHN